MTYTDADTHNIGEVRRAAPLFDDRRHEQDRRKYWRDKAGQDRRDAPKLE